MQLEDHQALSHYLQPHESLQWTGRPPGGLMFRKSDIAMVPFSLLWGGFAFFWEYGAYTAGAPIFFLLFGGVFVFVGFYIIIGRFFFDMLKRKNTIYGLTNERALILAGVFDQSLKSISLKSISEVSIQLNAHGRGTIVFGSSQRVPSMFSNSSWPGSGQTVSPSFEKIENASQVYQMVQSAQRT
jgi:hypothetical protein